MVLPDGQNLFGTLSLGLRNCLTGVFGAHGTGKTTWAKVIIGALAPATERIVRTGTIAYLPQNFVVTKEPKNWLNIGGYLRNLRH